MALGWLRWRAWAGVSGVAAAAIGVVGVVLWHFEIFFFPVVGMILGGIVFTLYDRYGRYGIGLTPVVRVGQSGRGACRGRRRDTL